MQIDSSAPDSPARPALQHQPTGEPRPLREEVLELIQPWRESVEKPPFSAGELIVIVLAISDEPQQTLKETHKNVFRTFKYYCEEALEHRAREIFRTAWPTFGIAPAVDKFDLFEALGSFDHPNCIGKMDTHSVYRRLKISDAVCTPDPSARIYLRNWLEPLREGIFDFVELPPEIRVKIFKMLLVYPKPWLALGKDHSFFSDADVRPGVASIEDIDSSDWENWKAADNDIGVESLTKTLGILCVSKQIGDEALPIFYGCNTIKFATLRHMTGALLVMSKETFHSIKDIRIVVTYPVQEPDSPIDFGKRLSRMPARKLVLVFRRGSTFWYDCCRGPEDRAATPDEMSRVDDLGLEYLVSFAERAEEVELQRNGFLRDWFDEKHEISGAKRVLRERRVGKLIECGMGVLWGEFSSMIMGQREIIAERDSVTWRSMYAV